MATMIPSVPVPRGGGEGIPSGEAKAFIALSALPDAWRVYHSKTYYLHADHPRGALREGEIDFLLLHPEHGLLVLEVKGGGISYDGREDRFTSVDRLGQTHEIRHPFRQAQQHEKDVVALLLGTSFGAETLPPFAHGHAVVFPDCEWSPGLDPASAPRELVLDVCALSAGAAALEARLVAILASFASGHATQPLGRRWVKRIGQHVLAPRFSLGLTLGAALEWEETALARLHDEQDLCLDFLALNPRVLVRGGAGTGKTLVACESARRLAASGKDVLLLCFNRPLGSHLRALCASLDGLPGRVRAGTYHELCRDLALRAGLPWAEPARSARDDTDAFWNEESGLLLLQAAEKLDERVDALLVDEAQDFRPEWWGVLASLLREGDAAPLQLFEDPGQDLWHRGGTFPQRLPVFPLRTNSRSTGALADFLARLAGPSARPSRTAPGAPRGEEPVLVRWSTADEERHEADRVVDRLLNVDRVPLDRIALIGTRRLANSCLAAGKAPELAGLPVEPIGDDGTTPTPGALRYATPTASRASRPTSSSCSTSTATRRPARGRTSTSRPRARATGCGCLRGGGWMWSASKPRARAPSRRDGIRGSSWVPSSPSGRGPSGLPATTWPSRSATDSR